MRRALLILEAALHRAWNWQANSLWVWVPLIAFAVLLWGGFLI